MSMGRSVACVGPTSLSVTALAETPIGTLWTVPAGTKSILGVIVHYNTGGVNDAVLPKVAKCRMYSEDVKLAPCDLLAEGIASMLTSGNGFQSDPPYYPLNIPVNGGEKIYFYGTQYVTTTTACQMAITVLYSDEGPVGEQYFYKACAAAYAISAVTAAVKYTDPTVYTVSGARKITGVYGLAWHTVGAAATGCIGKFQLESNDFQVPFSISWSTKKGNSILSVGGTEIALARIDGYTIYPIPELNIPVAAICNITQTYTVGPTTIVGAFVTGVQFVK